MLTVEMMFARGLQSLVRLRGQITKLQSSQAHMRGISSTITTSAATSRVGESMASVTKVMQKVGEVQNPQKIAHTMQQFQKENAKMEMGSEMIGDAIDNLFDSAEEAKKEYEARHPSLHKFNKD